MNFFLAGISVSALAQRCGRLYGCCVVRHGRRYLDRRCAAFPLAVSGAEHLRAALTAGPCLLVSNHVLIRAENAPLGLWTQKRGLTLLNQTPDGFILRRIVREQTGLPLHVVAKSDRGWWSPRPIVKLLQKKIGQPFGKGLMEGIEYVPIEHNPECFHRTFLQAAAGPVQRGNPLLIFPGKLRYDENGCHDSLADRNSTGPCIMPGAAHLARKFSLPIIPIYIDGAETWRPVGPTCVRFGPPFSTKDMTKAQINAAIVAGVRDLSPEQTPESISRAEYSRTAI